MVRFIYLTDTHIGANPIGFHQQPMYPNLVDKLFSKVQDKVDKDSIDFIIHGGDLVHTCDPTNIKAANQLCQFSVPTYLCLGNHDIDAPNALDVWFNYAPDLFVGNSPSYNIIDKETVIHILPNHWEHGYDYYWGEVQDPFLASNQIDQLEQGIQEHPNKIHILVTHSPVYGMPTEQSGLSDIIHEPPLKFQESIVALTKKYPNLKVVLSGHNHLNTLKRTTNAVFLTASSFTESPFEYKIIEVTKESINVSTCQIDLSDLDDVAPKYDDTRSYVQGRKKDRNLMWNINRG